MSKQHSSFFQKQWMQVLLVSSAVLTLYRIYSFDREYYRRAFSPWKGASAVSNNKTLIVVVACIRSNEGWKNVNETALHTLLVPSIEKTVNTSEWEQYRVELLAAFDKNDMFWENKRHRQDLANSTNIPISFVSILNKTRPHHIPFNEACRSAYEYGAEYIVRVNDDSEFVTPGWITQGVDTLKNYMPPNVGVVGPTCREGNTAILTHDMVHRTHLDIFADYYPDEFDNWFVDDWITHVYGPNRTTKISSWLVRHHISKHGTRYKASNKQSEILGAMLSRGKLRIQEYLHNGTKDPSTYQVLKSSHVDTVAGPLAALREKAQRRRH